MGTVLTLNVWYARMFCKLSLNTFYFEAHHDTQHAEGFRSKLKHTVHSWLICFISLPIRCTFRQTRTHILVSSFFRPLKWPDANELWTEAPHIHGTVGKRRGQEEERQRERERERVDSVPVNLFRPAGWVVKFVKGRKGGREEGKG